MTNLVAQAKMVAPAFDLAPQSFASTALIDGSGSSLGREILGWVGRPRCHEVMQRLRPDVGIPPEHLTLPPTFIQRERDSEFEFCPFGRFGQRGLARSFAGCAASGAV
ncbi:hypothetical protein, partial [Cereibacter changlensis]|uniref:hypothetical protein n=1 Tax=Cereibacter changlensis TaxID=402884 RepID=UPI001B808CA5